MITFPEHGPPQQDQHVVHAEQQDLYQGQPSCDPFSYNPKIFQHLHPNEKYNWQDLDLRNDNEDKPKCCTGNQKGRSELKTQTKLFQAPSSISKGSKLKNSLLPGPQKWWHFSAEKPVTWEGASPVWEPDAFLQHPHDAALKFSMQQLHTRMHCSDPICSRSSSNRH